MLSCILAPSLIEFPWQPYAVNIVAEVQSLHHTRFRIQRKLEQFRNVSPRKAFPAGEAPGSWCWLLSSPQPAFLSLGCVHTLEHVWIGVNAPLTTECWAVALVSTLRWCWTHPKLQQQISLSELGNQCCTLNFKSESDGWNLGPEPLLFLTNCIDF